MPSLAIEVSAVSSSDNDVARSRSLGCGVALNLFDKAQERQICLLAEGGSPQWTISAFATHERAPGV